MRSDLCCIPSVSTLLTLLSWSIPFEDAVEEAFRKKEAEESKLTQDQWR